MSGKRTAPKPLTVAQEGARALDTWQKRAGRLLDAKRYAHIGTPIDRPDLADEVWALLETIEADSGPVADAISRADEADAEEERAEEEEKRADEEEEHARKLDSALADVRLTIVRAREHLDRAMTRAREIQADAIEVRADETHMALADPIDSMAAAVRFLEEAIERADKPEDAE